MPTVSGSRLSYHTFKYITSDPSNVIQDRSLACAYTKSGGPLPDWRKRIRDGRSASTNFSGTIVTDFVTEGQASLDVEWKNGSGKWVPLFGTSWGTPLAVDLSPQSLPSDSATVLNVARARLASEIQGASRAIEGGVSLGELGETLRMIRRPFKTMYDDIPVYHAELNRRTRKNKNRAQLRKIIADTWLERAFGWVPLMNDIKAGCEALERMKHGPLDIRDRVRASAHSDVQTGHSLLVTNGKPYANSPLYRVRRISSTRVEYKLVAGVKIRDANRAQMARRLLGFRLQDFAPTLWELLPWSFLIDYFSNLGDVINSHSVNWSTVYFGVETRRLIGTVEFFWEVNDPQTKADWSGSNYRNLNYSASPSYRRVQNKSVNRVSKTPGASIAPDLMFEIPGCSMKWLNIAALAATRDRSRATFSRLG